MAPFTQRFVVRSIPNTSRTTGDGDVLVDNFGQYWRPTMQVSDSTADIYATISQDGIIKVKP